MAITFLHQNERKMIYLFSVKKQSCINFTRHYIIQRVMKLGWLDGRKIS